VRVAPIHGFWTGTIVSGVQFVTPKPWVLEYKKCGIKRGHFFFKKRSFLINRVIVHRPTVGQNTTVKLYQLYSRNRFLGVQIVTHGFGVTICTPRNHGFTGGAIQNP
jgi:hypothetical protein